jgi:two-component system sensor histidine kinase BaeS
MRLRIVHQLSLLLVGGVLLSLLLMAGFVGWNLKSGFSDYLRERDHQQLERFATLVAHRAETDPSLASLQNRAGMHALMTEFLQSEGLPARPQDEGLPAPPEAAQPPPRDDGPARDGPAMQRRPPPPPEMRAGQRPGAGGGGGGGGGDTLPERLHIVDAQRHHLAGRPVPRERPAQEVPIYANGTLVAYARLALLPELRDVDQHFLRRQYQGLALAGGLTLLLALAAARLAAGRFSRPLRHVQLASRRIAQGEFDVQLAPSGAEEMAQLMGDINQMAASLKKFESARRAWIAQISHELRTPLAVLRGELEAVEDGARQATPQLVKSLQDEVLQLIRLVNDLHTLSVADLGQLRCEFLDLDVGALVARAAQRFEARLHKAGLALELQAPAQPLRARWDAGRIEQLLANLLENSLRYTQAPGRIQLRWLAAGDNSVDLWVEDTPPAVRSQELAQLFEPLYRADSARQRHAGSDGVTGHGSGLGLAIVKAIAQAHGGTVGAALSPLGGLAIHIHLPLDPEQQFNQGGGNAHA